MNRTALSGTVRTEIGSKDAAQLRRAKRVPCVLYGGETVVHFSVDESALNKIIFTPEVHGVDLDLEGTTTLAMVQEKQFHPLTDRIIHVDFVELKEDRETRTRLAIRLKGQPAGVRKGGKMSQVLRKVRVKGLPADIPAFLELDVTELDINQNIRVADLKFKGVTMLERPHDVVVSVKMTKKPEEVVAPGAAPGAAAPAAKKAEPAKAAAKK
jgi:large subunit ribosomal protein L25